MAGIVDFRPCRRVAKVVPLVIGQQASTAPEPAQAQHGRIMEVFCGDWAEERVGRNWREDAG